MEPSELEQAKQNCSTDIEEHLYKIGMFAAMNHVTIKALRYYDELFTKMPQMGQEMEKLGCECSLPECCFTNYLEPRYKEEKISVELCETVTELKQDTECIQFKELEEVKEAACIFHKGPYRTLPQSYAKILKYIEENGLKISGNIRESYIDGIWNQNSEEDWLTEIQIPVEKIIRETSRVSF